MTKYVVNPFTGLFDATGSGGSGSGDVVGPGSSTNGDIVIFQGTTGKLIADSGVAFPIPATQGGTAQTTYTTGDILYASAANTLSKLPIGSVSQVLTVAGGIPSWAAASGGGVSSVSGTTNRITSTGGATPVIDISASYVGQSSITTLGTVTTGVWNGTSVDLAHGGTNANLTASNGGIFYSTASAGAILSGTATANQILMSGASTTPAWSTSTYPSTNAAGDLLYGSSSNVIGKLAIGTAPGRQLITDGSLPLWFTPFQYVYEYDDFITSNQSSSIAKLCWGRIAQNAGTIAYNTGDSDAAHPGILSLETGTNTNGAGGAYLGPTTFLFGGGLIRINMLIKLPVLSDGTDTYTFRAGFGDSTTGAAQVDGAYFEYTNGTNSGNYQIITASNSSRTTNNTSTAATTNWDTLTVECNAAGTSVSFSINGSAVANSPIATNIPTGAGRGFGVVVSMTKSAGTTNRVCLFDLFEIYQKLTASR